MWTWGEPWGDFSMDVNRSPRKVEGATGIAKIACGAFHNLLLSWCAPLAAHHCHALLSGKAPPASWRCLQCLMLTERLLRGDCNIMTQTLLLGKQAPPPWGSQCIHAARRMLQS